MTLRLAGLIMIMLTLQSCHHKSNPSGNSTAAASASLEPAFAPKTAKRTYRLAFKENLESFDPIAAVDETTGIILNLLHRNLFTTSLDGRLINDLVDRIFIDGPTVFLTIHSGLYFNEAPKKELTSEDILFCLTRLKDSGRQPWVLDRISSMQATGPYQLKLTMTSPSYWDRQKYLLSLPQTAIYSKTAFLQKNRFVGASTFTLTTFKPEELILTSTAGIQLDYKILPYESSRWFYYQRNKLDVYLAEGVFRFLFNDKNDPTAALNETSFRKINRMEPIVFYAAIVSRPGSVLADPHFRRALNYRLDRKNLAQKVLLGAYESSDYPVPDMLFKKLPPIYAYDKAYPCFEDQAGATPKKLPKETINIYTPPDRDRQLTAMVIRHTLSTCGLPAKIKVVDLPTLLKINNEKRPGLYVLKWIADYPHPENFLIPLFHSRNAGSGGNRSYYSNAQLDAILDDQGVTTQNLEKIEDLIRHDAPWLFIGFAKKEYFVNARANIHIPAMYTGWNEEAFGIQDLVH